MVVSNEEIEKKGQKIRLFVSARLDYNANMDPEERKISE